MASNARLLLDPKAIKKASQMTETKSSPDPSWSDSSKQSRVALTTPSSSSQPVHNSSRPLGVYDHRALLSPRTSHQARTPPNMNLHWSSNETPKVPSRSSTETDQHSQRPGRNNKANGPKSMLESVYGVENRSTAPRKKVKLTTEDDQTHSTTKATYTHRPTNGIVGKYMRPEAENAAEISKNNLVDLTNDEDDKEDADDDIQIVSSHSLDNQEVCFGHMPTTVHAHMVPKPKSESVFHQENEWPVMRCTLVRTSAKDTVIDVLDPSGATFGKINPEFAAALAPAMDGLKGLRTQAKLINRRKKPNEWYHQPCSEQLKMIINIYGRRGDVDKVGRHFGHFNFWFRPPMASDPSIPIVNPHAQKRPVYQPARNPGQSRPLSDTRTLEEATEAVSKLFDSFANASRDLAETNPPDFIIATSLLSHQKQALTFLLRHEQRRTFGHEESENSSLWRRKQRKNGDVYYHEVVSGISVKDEPEQVFGGLLADVMGLGKTLEALSLIASTLDESKKFAQEKVNRDDQNMVLEHSMGTLIICPTSTVKNWEDQIAQHVKPGSMTYHVYHGPGREKNPYKLLQYDIVITTYGIVTSESSNKTATSVSPLKQLKWFRIVLDEAHTIREARAIQSQATYSLDAQRRWCLTGTPIQNRLDDLGSLTRFLRLYPYDQPGLFNQYIRAPAQAGDPAFLKALRVFVDSFTLRRLRDRIDLPERKDYVDHLKFSTEEKRLHDFFREIAHVQIQQLTRRKDKNSGVQHHVLRGIMTLRLICAHGRDLLKGKDLEKLKGISATDAIDVDEDATIPTISRKAALESLNLRVEAQLDTCRNCERTISKDNTKADAEDDEGLRCFILPCFDLLCADCFGSVRTSFDSTADKEAVTCPFCSAQIAAQYVGFSGSTAQEIVTAPDDTTTEEEDGEPVQVYSGPHTKTIALLQDIAKMTEDSLALEAAGEPPLKCVVFSEFTSHLDLIGRALNDNGYTFVRIDGTMSLNNRKKALDALSSDDTVKILLASIKAAGQGLNLTAASRAFIMEPMWNPAAEAQAVDRIYRIGQKRPVLVKRYQMEESIEGKIVELQKRKQQLADVSINQDYKQLSKQEVREQHMKEILALFK